MRSRNLYKTRSKGYQQEIRQAAMKGIQGHRHQISRTPSGGGMKELDDSAQVTTTTAATTNDLQVSHRTREGPTWHLILA